MNGVELLYASSAHEWQTEQNACIGDFGYPEIEILGLNVFPCIKADGIFACTRFEDVKIGGIMIIIILNLDTIWLSAFGSQLQHHFIVLQCNNCTGTSMQNIKRTILVDRCCFGGNFLNYRHGRHRRSFRSRYGVSHRLLGKGYRILLSSKGGLFSGLFVLIKSKTKKDCCDKD